MLLAALQILVCSFGALLFARSAAAKFRSLTTFRGVVANYRLLPPHAIAPVAIVLPALELAVAIALLGGPVREWGAIGAGFLCAAFATAVAINIRRGRSSIDCGCGAAYGSHALSWEIVARNTCLLLAFCACALPLPAVPWSTQAVALVAGAAAYLIYAGYETVAAVANYPRPRLAPQLRRVAWGPAPEGHP